MTCELVTGYAGVAHISAEDDGMRNVGTYGGGKYVLDTGANLACTVQNANTATIGTGDAIFEGRHVRVSAAESVSLANGTQGYKRNDIVAIHYSKDALDDTESATIEVIQGTPSTSTPADPTIPSGSIIDGDSDAYMPLWRITIDGLQPQTPVAMFGEVMRPLYDCSYGSVDAARVDSGTLGVARIPDLGATYLKRQPSSQSELPQTTSDHIFPICLSESFSNGGVVSYMTESNFCNSLGLGAMATKDSVAASDITSGTLPTSRGGTGRTVSGKAYMMTNLYNGAENTGTVTLSDNANEYTFLEIYFRSSSTSGVTRLYPTPGWTNLTAVCGATSGDALYISTRNVTVSGNKITTNTAGSSFHGTVTITSAGITFNPNSKVGIYCVDGYK